MHNEAGTGWQIIFADLAIILFMTTALSVKQDAPAKTLLAAEVPDTVPVAIWRQTQDGESLNQWLADQGRDPRVRFSFTFRYSQNETARPDLPLVELAQLSGRKSRISVEPGDSSEIMAVARYEGAEPKRRPE